MSLLRAHGIHWTSNVAVAVAAASLRTQSGAQLRQATRALHTNPTNGNASPNAIRKAMTCLRIHPPPPSGASAGDTITTPSRTISNHLTMGVLRTAYFEAAKECHPDSASASTCQSMSEAELNQRFLQVTESYELLQRNLASIGSSLHSDNETSASAGTSARHNMEIDYITKSEEENFRTSCREILGLDAETVEESKQCPLFREWLKGRTDAAFTWNTFFMLNGGLAPMLNTKQILSLSEGTVKTKRRRRKP